METTGTFPAAPAPTGTPARHAPGAPAQNTTGAPAQDTSGTLDEALERIHTSGPEFYGFLSNHAPMAVEALVRHGQAAGVHRWFDRYSERLEEMPRGGNPVTPENWREALGDPGRVADWIVHFERETTERPWREVLTEWWPRLLPGIAGSATHPAIRVGHAVRTLLSGEETAPRVGELAQALGYWTARHLPLPEVRTLGAPPGAAAALDAVPAVPDQSGGIGDRFAQLTALPGWPLGVTGPEDARDRLRELVAASTRRYAAHGHADPVMLVHAATAPNAVLRTLPALPRELWLPSLGAAWAASAGVTAAYSTADPRPYTLTDATAEEVFERAAAHGDDHTIKFADTALDVGDSLALTAAVGAIEWNPPLLT
ncbi:questin oxidase family protein [Streptomyces sp. NPDC001889]